MYKLVGKLLLICLSLFVLGGCGDCKPCECIVTPECPPTPTPVPTEPPNQEFYVPDNCSNPPEHLSSNDGFKCKGSETRGDTVVCLLPHQFTWKPHKMKNDGNNTFACNENDEHFDTVKIFFKDSGNLQLHYAGCHNPVFLPSGKVGRQHFRNESVKWKDIKRKVSFIRMVKNGKRACLKF